MDLEDDKSLLFQDLTDVGASYTGNFSASGVVVVNQPIKFCLKSPNISRLITKKSDSRM